MRISIITVVWNQHAVIEDCLKSVLAQSYPDIEHIVIDGASTDGTMEIVRRYQDRISKIVSEKDAGSYDAMNKGLKLATGDVIGFLHADDLYAGPDVVKNVVKTLIDAGTESLYGDLVYVQKKDTEQILRDWRSGEFTKDSFRQGWMPPHPTFFARREVYERLGGFDTRFSIAADYELLLRFLYQGGVSAVYLPQVLVRMRWGGLSNRSLSNMLTKSLEDYKACRRYGLGIGTVLSKNFSKLPQFFQGRNNWVAVA